MKRISALSVFACSLLVVGQVSAESWSKQLTRDSTSDPMYTFTIKAEPLKRAHNLAQIDKVGEFLEFTVAVKPVASAEQLEEARKQGWRPHYSGELRVVDGKKFIAARQVQPTVRDAERTFTFQIAAKSGFTFTQTEGEVDGGGISYWFHLGDFVASK